MKMPFGPYRGAAVQHCPRHYLASLLQWSATLPHRLVEEIENVLCPDGGCLGPRWWHVQQAKRRASA
jgi:hypothetical protein